MKTSPLPLQLISLPGHSCQATKDGWAGRYVSHTLRQGIRVDIIKVSITRDQVTAFKYNETKSDYMVGCVVLKGQLRIKYPNKSELSLEPNKFSLFATQALNFSVTAPKQEILYMLAYSFPLKVLGSVGKGGISNISPCFGNDKVAYCRYLGIPLNREIHRSVAEIMGSRLKGPLLKLYLEGAILQTLAHKIDELRNLPAESDLLPPKNENDLLQDAYEYLLSDLLNPPTAKELATRFDMTEHRLRAGFKRLFDTTIYNALLTRRMILAKEKIEEGKLSLITIARSLGYKHVSNFISSFTRHYGLPPKAYMKRSNKP